MEDELERARRALSRVDAELDAARVLSRVRDGATSVTAPLGRTGSPAPGARSSRAGGARPETVEVAVLRPARLRRPARLLGAVAAAAVLVAGLVAGPWWAVPDDGSLRVVGAPAPGPGTPTGGADPAAEVLGRVRDVVSGGGYCAVRTRTRSPDGVVAERVDASTPPAPDGPVALGDGGASPAALGTLAVEALRSLAPGGAAGHAPEPVTAVSATPVAPGVGLDAGADGSVRLTVTPSGPEVLDAHVTRVEYLVDAATWLPRTQELTVQPDAGEPVVALTELEWAACGG